MSVVLNLSDIVANWVEGFGRHDYTIPFECYRVHPATQWTRYGSGGQGLQCNVVSLVHF